MKKLTLQKVLQAISNYIMFFLLVGFVTSCCMMLFMRILTSTTDIVFTSENIGDAAKLTFANVMLLTFLFTSIDWLRRKWTVERPVNRITQAAEKVMQGDLSARVELRSNDADQFAPVIQCFNQMVQELSSLETLRTDFISNVSHEMKTPLAVMQNYATLLQQPDLSEENRLEYAQAISDAARRLSSMMTNILKLNRLENQQIYPQSSQFDLSEQLCRCLLQFETVWEREQIELDADIEEGITIKADEELLSLVWNNLLSNAFKFTPSGGTVRVCLRATDRHAIITVADTGCGMTPETGRHIFEKFYQGDTSRATQGNGLGLALVKRVIDILQGQISVESAVGKGTTFTVIIRRD